MTTRRQFLQTAVGAAAIAVYGSLPAAERPLPQVTASKLPRWRGFNLLEKFTHQRSGPFKESDFEIMAEFGFDFVRLPMSYRCWTDANPENWQTLDEKVLKDIDQAIEFGRKHCIHVNLNLHRAPGYCVNPPEEPLDLWTSEKAQDAFAFHWQHFARRYKGIPNAQVSFDLLNEPKDMPEEPYARVMRRIVAAIREVDPGRLIVIDGLKWGQKPVESLADLGIAQSTRGYMPNQISHYRASWINIKDWPEPAWPMRISETDVWDRQRLAQHIEPWKAIEKKGVGVHVGEWGAYSYTPHKVALAWMKDCLELWKEAGWGWSLWNLRGAFGILNSNRRDVSYEDYRGMKLDRAMLDLLRAH